MDEILERYRQGKFQKCLELIELQKPSDDLTNNFIRQNCSLVCRSIIAILQNNEEESDKMEQQLYQSYENVTSVGQISTSIPLQLKLIVVFNLFWWILFGGKEVKRKRGDNKNGKHLKLINSALCRVLGKDESIEPIYLNVPEKIIENLCHLEKCTRTENSNNFLLAIEIAALILIFVAKWNIRYLAKCIYAAEIFLKDAKQAIHSKDSLNEFFNENTQSLPLFKFGFHKISDVLNDINSSSIDFLSCLNSAFQYLSGNFRESLKIIRNCGKSNLPLLNYLAALNSFEDSKKKLCLAFVKRSDELNVSKLLKMRFLILNGRLESSENNHKEAAKNFMDAIGISPDCPASYFYVGHQWGKMGLTDMMVEYFEKLLQAVRRNSEKETSFCDFESLILDWIHPLDEITESEALYVLAISYALNERFCEAASAFERHFCSEVVLSPPPKEGEKRIVEMPNRLTVYHDASVTHLIAGNLTKAEEIALIALTQYRPRDKGDSRTVPLCKDGLMGKDITWLERTIQEELLEVEASPEDAEIESLYREEIIYFLPENVIALLILSEVQRVQKSVEYSVTLKRIFVIFSAYLADLVKRERLPESEKSVSCLIKTLACKTCLAIARYQIQMGNFENVEKMMKRSLSCNKGDKDVLYEYCKFLMETGRRRDAWKLWNSFYENKSIISTESVQSLSLRYFLSHKITIKEMEKIRAELSSMEF